MLKARELPDYVTE